MTIKEIAQLAGVSISTVSKIMNQKDESIRPETRERVLRIAREYHYMPYSNAAGGKGKTFLLGVLVCSCAHSGILEGILDQARAQGYSILLSEHKGSPEQERGAIAGFCQNRADGVLWEPASDSSLNEARSFQSSGIPYVTFQSSGKNLPSDFHMDFENLGYTAAALLTKAGHQNIAFLLPPGEDAGPVLDGCKKNFFDAGLPFPDTAVYHTICDELTSQIAAHAVTGVLCARYSDAVRLFGVLNQLHIRVPEDVSLVSLREEAEAAGYPRISSVLIPAFPFGQHLCEAVIRMLEQKTAPALFHTSAQADCTDTISAPCHLQAPGLTVVGSIHIDHYLKVNRLPVSGITGITTGETLYPGGKGVNQAIGAARLGARVSLIGSAGGDADANLIFTALTENGCDPGWILRKPGCSTGQAHVFVQADGESTISILSGANSALSAEDILHSEGAFRNSSYCLMQTELPLHALIQAGKLAHAHGMKTILKPAACSSLDENLLRLVDLLIPNRQEADMLCPGKPLSEQADYFLGFGMEAVVITLGEKGCYLKTRGLEETVPAADFPSFDSTGAGDAFICALAVYLQKGYPIQKAVRIASYAAGFSITREGVVPSLIDRNTLEAYIMRVEPDLLSF